MDKYQIAANVELACLDGKTLRAPAKTQRQLFGFPVFGRKEIRIDASGQGVVEVKESCWEGTHTSYHWQPYSFETVAEMSNASKKF